MFIYDKQCEKRKTSAVSICALVQSGAPCWKKSRGNRAREINPCKDLFLNLSNGFRKLAFMTAAMMIQLRPLPNIKTHSQVDKDTTKLAYMRAAMTSLAYVHGITFSFMKVASLKSWFSTLVFQKCGSSTSFETQTFVEYLDEIIFQSLGGKEQLLAEFPTIKEQVGWFYIFLLVGWFLIFSSCGLIFNFLLLAGWFFIFLLVG